MKKTIILLASVFVLLNCKNRDEKKENVDGTTFILEIGCYTYNFGNNSITFEITGLDDGVSGNLADALEGKDSNRGTFKGQLSGDKLFGLYTFISEGTESNRELAFMMKESKLIEGYGPLNASGTAFEDKSKIVYSATMPLIKTDCTK